MESFWDLVQKKSGAKSDVEFAVKAGISPDAMRDWRRGRHAPSVEGAVKAAGVAGLDPVAVYLGGQLSAIKAKVDKGGADETEAVSFAKRLLPILRRNDLTDKQEQIIAAVLEELVAIIEGVRGVSAETAIENAQKALGIGVGEPGLDEGRDGFGRSRKKIYGSNKDPYGTRAREAEIRNSGYPDESAEDTRDGFGRQTKKVYS